MRLARLSLAAVVFAATLVPVVARADDSHPSNAFYLVNRGSIAVNFSYACKGDTDTYKRQLPSKYHAWYWSNSGCLHYIVRITTEDSEGNETPTVKYLNAGTHYEIFWDKDHRVWNIDEY